MALILLAEDDEGIRVPLVGAREWDSNALIIFREQDQGHGPMVRSLLQAQRARNRRSSRPSHTAA